MKLNLIIFILLAGIFVASGSLIADDSQTDRVAAAAFYEGESLNYVIYPPDNFRMESEKAVADGYSFAFVPSEIAYDAADMMIGVNIYKIRGMSFTKAMANDTSSVRKHYGQTAVIEHVDSIFTGNGDAVPTFYIYDKDRFIPNVMISYFDGVTEMVIFELVITDRMFRPDAEKIYLSCLEKFKPLQLGELSTD